MKTALSNCFKKGVALCRKLLHTSTVFVFLNGNFFCFRWLKQNSDLKKKFSYRIPFESCIIMNCKVLYCTVHTTHVRPLHHCVSNNGTMYCDNGTIYCNNGTMYCNNGTMYCDNASSHIIVYARNCYLAKQDFFFLHKQKIEGEIL